MGSDDGLDGPERSHSLEARAVEQLSVWLGQAIQEGRAVLNSPCTSTTRKNDYLGLLRFCDWRLEGDAFGCPRRTLSRWFAGEQNL